MMKTRGRKPVYSKSSCLICWRMFQCCNVAANRPRTPNPIKLKPNIRAMLKCSRGPRTNPVSRRTSRKLAMANPKPMRLGQCGSRPSGCGPPPPGYALWQVRWKDLFWGSWSFFQKSFSETLAGSQDHRNVAESCSIKIQH